MAIYYLKQPTFIIFSFFILAKVYPTASTKKIVPIQKYCSIGLVFTYFGDSRPPECLEVVEGKNWTATLYNSETLRPLDRNELELVEPEYLKSDLECEGDDWIFVSARPPKAGDRPLVILLDNGKLMWRSDKCTGGQCKDYRPFPTTQFYIDGLGFPLDGLNSSRYSGHEYDQIVYYCNAIVVEAESLATHHLIATSRIYLGVLMVTCFLYLLTTITYILLWKTQTLPGRTLLSVVLSRTLMSFFLCLAYIGQIHRWDINVPHWWCVFVGVAAYFFLISAYSWVLLLNFDFWWTFRSLRAYSNAPGMRKKYIQYSCFGWGVPLLITALSVVIDTIYKSDLGANPFLVPNYGNGICFMVITAQSVYIYLVQTLFLLPALVLAGLTVYAMKKARKGSTSIRKHGKKDVSSFQLYMKLFVVMSVSWIVHLVIWLCQHEPKAGEAPSVTTKVLLFIQSIDAIGSAALIFLIYVCKQSISTKLEQNYTVFRVLVERLSEVRRKIQNDSSTAEKADSASQPSHSSTNIEIDSSTFLKTNLTEINKY